MPHDVFISHSTDDKLVALALCNKLESAGVRCWMAPRDVGPGAEWGKAIVDAISSCRLMVLVFSSKANESRHIRREVQTAFEKDLIVIPFRVENTQPTGTMEYYLGSVHWLDALTPPVENHLMGVVERVKALLPAAVQEPAAPVPETKPGDSHDKKIAAEDDERFETPNRKENRTSSGSKSGSSFDRSGFSDIEWETLLFTPMWIYSAVVWVDGAPKAYEKEALNRELARAESYEVPLFRQFLEVSRAEWNDLMPRWNADPRNTPDGLRDARRILDAKLSANEAKAFKECLYQFGRAIAESGGERGQGGGVLQMPKVSFDEQDTLIDISIMLGLQEGLRPTSAWLASMVAALDQRAVPPPDKVPAVLEPATSVEPSRPSLVVPTSPQPQRPEPQPAEVTPFKSKEIPLTKLASPPLPPTTDSMAPSTVASMRARTKLLIIFGSLAVVILLATAGHFVRLANSHKAEQEALRKMARPQVGRFKLTVSREPNIHSSDSYVRGTDDNWKAEYSPAILFWLGAFPDATAAAAAFEKNRGVNTPLLRREPFINRTGQKTGEIVFYASDPSEHAPYYIKWSDGRYFFEIASPLCEEFLDAFTDRQKPVKRAQ